MLDHETADERTDDHVAFWRDYMTDPFAVRGLHLVGGQWLVRTFQPGAFEVELLCHGSRGWKMKASPVGLFTCALPSRSSYRLRVHWPNTEQETEDPYSFGLNLSDFDLALFSRGAHLSLAHKFGAVPTSLEGVPGVSFAVWAPNARRVSVVGDFNTWNGLRHPMRLRHEAGVWEIFIPRLTAGERYKYEIEAMDGKVLPLKADPIARAAEHPPATASVVASVPAFEWSDSEWMERRHQKQHPAAPIAIYEVHAGSWRRPDGTPSGTLNWKGLARLLIPYVKELGFTHIEVMPIMEHPFGGSWGYQPLSQFAPTARYGSPAEFAQFVNACHRVDLGVILDWVPGHFPDNSYGLADFDGTALYEHADPREGIHPDWNTHIYNHGRTEVQGFLAASALWWIQQYHVDGLRVDAVASMLYRDYSRKDGQWIPNIHGGHENLESVSFLRRLNALIREHAPGAITIAEESTAWPNVTAPESAGGLGFSYKWNMGWMHDTLAYVNFDPIYRRWHHNQMTFGLLNAFAERFVLPLSHDEVVYGKGSLYNRIPGNHERKLATLRAYYAFMWTHPGKKMMFMGDEYAAKSEWNHDTHLDWTLLDDAGHAGVKILISDLAQLYRSEPALHRWDADPRGFEWLVSDDSENGVFAYARNAENSPAVVILVNMTPVPRPIYRVGAPWPGHWSEILNTDSRRYGGDDIGNAGGVNTEPISRHSRPQSLSLTLPPLGAIVLKHTT